MFYTFFGGILDHFYTFFGGMLDHFYTFFGGMKAEYGSELKNEKNERSGSNVAPLFFVYGHN